MVGIDINRKAPNSQRASLSQIKTGRTTKEGLTISTGAELKTGKGVKEVPKAEGCCALS